MKRKRFIKLVMSYGVSRDMAVFQANEAKKLRNYEKYYRVLSRVLSDLGVWVCNIRPMTSVELMCYLRYAQEYEERAKRSEEYAKQLYKEDLDKAARNGNLYEVADGLWSRCPDYLCINDPAITTRLHDKQQKVFGSEDTASWDDWPLDV